MTFLINFNNLCWKKKTFWFHWNTNYWKPGLTFKRSKDIKALFYTSILSVTKHQFWINAFQSKYLLKTVFLFLLKLVPDSSTHLKHFLTKPTTLYHIYSIRPKKNEDWKIFWIYTKIRNKKTDNESKRYISTKNAATPAIIKPKNCSSKSLVKSLLSGL